MLKIIRSKEMSHTTVLTGSRRNKRGTPELRKTWKKQVFQE
jgi:hypothetical protein